MPFQHRVISLVQARRIRTLRSTIRRKAQSPKIKTEVLAGITVALALIPESLAFAAIARVNPMVALYTSFCMAVVTAIAGGRPAMISAATGSMALLMTTLVAKHGVEYLLAATVLTGALQILIGIFNLGRFFSFIPPSVIAGFVNALGILIFLAQLQQFAGESWQMYVMVAVTLGMVYLFPKVSKALPAPLVAIVSMTVFAIAVDLPIRRVGDIGEITRSLPSLHLPAVSISLKTIAIILPYSVTLAIVGLLESLLTATLVDELTDTRSSRNQEIKGQGIANVVTGFLGGMAGCGMVGQSIINVRSGGRTRLSTAVSGAFLLFAIFALRDLVQQIPMAALVGVMIMIAFETFDWNSLKTLRKTPFPEAIVMPITVTIVLLTHDLTKGVLVGVLISLVIFGWQAAQIRAIPTHDSGLKTYHLTGQLFSGSANHLLELFDYQRDPDRVVLDFTTARLWDWAAAAAVARVIQKYQMLGTQVTLSGLDSDSQAIAKQSGLMQLADSDWIANCSAEDEVA